MSSVIRQRYLKLGIIKPQKGEDVMTKKNSHGTGSAKNATFHNPYHFVPVAKPDNKWHEIGVTKETKARRKEFTSRLPRQCRHDLYVDKTNGEKVYHGRICCKLRTVSPIFIGARRIKDGTAYEPACIAPFELDDKPAIPASSLRGLISSVAEAASNSALRVLEERVLSHRKSPREALSALGLLIVKEEKGKKIYKLFPLTLPIMRTREQMVSYRNRQVEYNKLEKNRVFHLDDRFEKIFKNNSVPLKICFKDEKDSEGKKLITYSDKNKQYYYMNIRAKYLNEELKTDDNSLRYRNVPDYNKKKNRKVPVSSFLLYQKGFGKKILKAKTYENNSHAGKWTKGIVRIFKYGRRKYQYFIPFDEIKDDNLLGVPDKVVEKFHLLAKERNESTKKEKDKENILPYLPEYVPRNTSDDPQNRDVELKNHDIVFFNVDDNGNVNEISFSAIWREKSGGSVHEYFGDIHKELLPFNPDRKKVSPAELLFGFTEDWKGRKKDKADAALAYRGRVRFSHALLEDEGEEDPYLKKVILKILDKPKPPSPALYFTKIGQPCEFIEKYELKRNNGYAPKGRKFYLHYREEREIREHEGRILHPWETHPDLTRPGVKQSRLKQKVEIRPVKKERTFSFHVDFENLDQWELGMLCYSLKPAENFLHKIGMGKPIGLGSVEIQVEKIEYINRLKRYSEDDLFNSDHRYHTENDPNFETLRNAFKTWAQEKIPDIIHALELLGNRDAVKYRVHTPLTMDQRGAAEEKETFKWFVNNEKNDKNQGGKQQLKSITPQDSEIPTLNRN